MCGVVDLVKDNVLETSVMYGNCVYSILCSCLGFIVAHIRRF